MKDRDPAGTEEIVHKKWSHQKCHVLWPIYRRNVHCGNAHRRKGIAVLSHSAWLACYHIWKFLVM